MLDKLKKIFSRWQIIGYFPYGYTLLTIALLLTVLILGKVFQPLELAIYDLNFLLRAAEPTDERIVIVEWDEKSIQMLEETTISDDTLFNLLSKIERQQPKIIGLDLYRDIPVLSPRLSEERNLRAYNSLSQFFSRADNLIGIEKVVNPTINAPKILKQKEQVAASDIATDRDDTVRRAYIFPQIDESGAAAGIPYLGVALGYQYLESEGWTAEQLEDRSLKIAKERESITVKPLATFNSDPYGLDTLINWRKGSPSFRQVSVTEVISNQIPPDLFRDRLVLIGNVSASTADRHNLPFNRGSDLWSYGVQIPAQVASSIIGAAIDGRPLLQAASKPVELGLVLISALSIVAIVTKYQNFDIKSLYLTTFLYALGLTLCLLLLNIIIFTKGLWLPVATAIGSIWIIYLFTNYYIYQERSRKNVLKLEMFVRDLQHSLGNPLNSIASSTNRIQISTQEVEQSIKEDSYLIGEHELPTFYSETLGITLQKIDPAKHLEIVRKRAVNIEKQVLRIERYRKRTEDFINFGYLNKTNASESVAINQFVSAIVARFESENEYDYQFEIYQDYDPRLQDVELDTTAMEIVLENLLDNAAYAVAPRDSTSDRNPLIRVQTKQNNKTIELRVEDNGVGIPMAMQQKIFQPFVSFNYRQGIGLYLTKRILSMYGGKIGVESREGKGCKFTVTLPMNYRTRSR